MTGPNLEASLSLPTIRSKVFKDECIYCFDSPQSTDGLYICVRKFIGVCAKHITNYRSKEPESVVFLNLSRKRIDNKTVADSNDCEKVTKLAIGIEGGFVSKSDNAEFEDIYTLVKWPSLDDKIPLNQDRIDGDLLAVCNALIVHDGEFRSQQLELGVWDGEIRPITKHVDLEQVESPPIITKDEWKCAEKDCDLTSNLWLNLTDGVVKCGRKQYLALGMFNDGRNHMHDHYLQTGRSRPLVVKLGTVTSEGDADLFSYDEDQSVIDPNLAAHLRHFCIDIKQMNKSEKSTLELELDMNQKWEWSLIQEEDSLLESAYGPGFTGMINLGSSCYINSSIQMLCQVPDFVSKFHSKSDDIFFRLSVDEVHENFEAQISKLFHSLLSGDYSKKPSINDDRSLNGIKPRQFRHLLGRGHTEFSTAKQQDAEEYIRYLFDKIDTLCSSSQCNPVDAFRFRLELRLEDRISGRVRYSDRNELILTLPVPPLDSAINNEQVIKSMHLPPDQRVRPLIPLSSCLDTFLADHAIEGFKSPISGEMTGARQRYRFGTFPDFLLVQIQKFHVNPDGTTRKLDVELQIPLDENWDLSGLRGHGFGPDEQQLSDDEDAQMSPAIDQSVVDELMSMGFPAASCRKAVFLTGNSGLPTAIDWVMNHLDDVDFAQELPDFGQRVVGVDSAKVAHLTVLGFTEKQAKLALGQNNGDLDSSAEWLFINAGQIPDEVEQMDIGKKDVTQQSRDGVGKYRLVGFISHMGASVHSGHYVCHLLKDGRWTLYNDEKVAFSQKPPIGLAYLYLFRRTK